ncbi:MAG: C69 family dipeptidase [Clostridia bacterium]|nr:C69 family dipeptidase [Clostridia bacterium]
MRTHAFFSIRAKRAKRLAAAMAFLLALTFGAQALACTTILVGKDASATGDAFFGRTVDVHGLGQVTLVSVPARMRPASWTYVDDNTGLAIDLPARSCQYTMTPQSLDALETPGVWAESCINAYGVSMSATESIYANDKALAADPYVENGIAESNIPTIVIPYVKTAREGVERLGTLVEKYGCAESNGVAFGDGKEIWYMELYTGHQWAAQRVPDDCYAVIGNDALLGAIDLADKANFLASKDIWTLAEKNGFLVREADAPHLARTYGAAHRNYSQLRVWAGQKMFSPSLSKKYDVNATFAAFVKPDERIALNEVMELMRYRYEDTPYDANKRDDTRPIGIPRTSQAHIFQLRAQKPAILWLSMSSPEFSVFLPLYGDLSGVPESYAKLSPAYDHDSAYWRFRTLSSLAALDRDAYGAPVRAHWKAMEMQLMANLPAMDDAYAKSGYAPETAAALFADIAEQALADADMLTGELLYQIADNAVIDTGASAMADGDLDDTVIR